MTLPPHVRAAMTVLRRWAVGHTEPPHMDPELLASLPENVRAALVALESEWAALDIGQRLMLGQVRVNCLVNGVAVLDRVVDRLRQNGPSGKLTVSLG